MCVCERIRIKFAIYKYFYYLMVMEKEMSVRELISVRNDILFKIAVSSNVDETKKLNNELKLIDYKISSSINI